MPTDVDPNFPYGLDRPRLARGSVGLAMLLGALSLIAVIAVGIRGPRALVVLALLVAFVAVLLISAGMFRTSRTTKIQATDRMLDGLALRGDEQALDLGCGSGLLCAGLAVRLPRGSVIGVDAWVENHLTPTGKPLAKRTLQLAGVQGVQLRTGTIRELPVADAAVDLAVSRDVFALLPGPTAEAEAIAELARVVRPGGRVALLEPFGSRRLAARLRAAGFVDVHRTRRWWSLMPPHRLVTARRAG